MSELTSCNYCTLRAIRNRAPKGARVIVREHDGRFSGFEGGVDVFVVPAGIAVSDDDDLGSYHKCWFMELTTKCAC